MTTIRIAVVEGRGCGCPECRHLNWVPCPECEDGGIVQGGTMVECARCKGFGQINLQDEDGR